MVDRCFGELYKYMSYKLHKREGTLEANKLRKHLLMKISFNHLVMFKNSKDKKLLSIKKMEAYLL